MFRTALLFTLCLPAFAQIRNLATNDDGSVFLFESDLRLTGTNDGSQSKIFRWDGAFSVVYSATTGPENVLFLSYAKQPSLSGDAQTLSYANIATCVRICMFPTVSTMKRGEVVKYGRGNPVLSRNGRYAAAVGFGTPAPTIYRFDMLSGEEVIVTADSSAVAVTDSGSVLLANEAGLRFVTRGQADKPAINGSINRFAGISADGSRILYVTRHDGVYNLRDQAGVFVSIEDKLDNGEPITGLSARVSNNGARAVIIEQQAATTYRASWMDLNSRQRVDLGVAREGAATISGDGRVAWIVQPDGTFARMVLDTGERTVVGEPIPVMTRPQLLGAPARGSLNRLEGTGFEIDPSWHATFSNDQLTLDLPIVETTDQHLDFQIPWSLPQAQVNAWLGIGRKGGTFELVRNLFQIQATSPLYWYNFDVPTLNKTTVLKAVHQDFASLVTQANPARPGEVVHIYMSGLGPVAPIQADAAPAPYDPPARLAWPFSCVFLFNDQPSTSARVVDAVLAGGMVGVYQVELEIPQAKLTGSSLFCSMLNPETGRFSGAMGALPTAN